jgi:hypothetical protein
LYPYFIGVVKISVYSIAASSPLSLPDNHILRGPPGFLWIHDPCIAEKRSGKTNLYALGPYSCFYTTGLMTSSFLRVRIRRICEKGDLPDEAIVLSCKTDVHL